MIGTIVCVDDQAEVRRLLGDVFRARGGNVVSFDDGEDAIAWLGGNEADLVILDLDLGAGPAHRHRDLPARSARGCPSCRSSS